MSNIKISSPDNKVYNKLGEVKPFAEPLSINFYFANRAAQMRYFKQFCKESIGGNKIIGFRVKDVKTIIHGSYELPDVMSFYYFATLREMRNFLTKTRFDDIIVVNIKDVHLKIIKNEN